MALCVLMGYFGYFSKYAVLRAVSVFKYVACTHSTTQQHECLGKHTRKLGQSKQYKARQTQCTLALVDNCGGDFFLRTRVQSHRALGWR